MMKLTAEWTDDCQGKKDYDADLVQLSTRYWPRGGGLTFTTNRTPTGTAIMETNGDQTVKPSAAASIYIQDRELVRQEFEAETEAEVKAAVERWAQDQFDRITRVLTAEFGSPSAK